jgi:hypothetical protein
MYNMVMYCTGGMTLQGSAQADAAVNFQGVGFTDATYAPVCLTGDTTVTTEHGEVVRLDCLASRGHVYLVGREPVGGLPSLVLCKVVTLEPTNAQGVTITNAVYRLAKDVAVSMHHTVLSAAWPDGTACRYHGRACELCKQVQVPGLTGYVAGHLPSTVADQTPSTGLVWYHIIQINREQDASSPSCVVAIGGHDKYYSEVLRCPTPEFLAAAGWKVVPHHG